MYVCMYVCMLFVILSPAKTEMHGLSAASQATLAFYLPYHYTRTWIPSKIPSKCIGGKKQATLPKKKKRKQPKKKRGK